MKYIFDFDDVLFNTKQLKECIYLRLDKVGIQYKTAEAYYKKVRGGEFSLKNFIYDLLKQEKISEIKMEDVYEDIMKECLNCINIELVSIVKKLGKENCYLVTYGEQEFNKTKVERSNLAPLFSEIYIVPGSKKEIIYEICNRFKNEKVIFIDDKIKFIEDIDLKKCPNLKTILYTGQNSSKLMEEINSFDQV